MNQIGIITVGTELADGQIVDTNSSWIASQLEHHHFRPTFHITVADRNVEFQKAVSFAENNCDTIFICGGLGPTKDDKTRNFISEHLELSLELHQDSWANIQNKLNHRGVVIRDGHQTQAMLPNGATCLENSYGVAPGFKIENKNNTYWVLPGPPQELKAIWKEHIDPVVKNCPRTSETNHLTTWMCLGIPESELAHLTESHFESYAFSKDYGYRIQLPYVEVKVWTEEPKLEHKLAFEAFERYISQYFVSQNIEDLQKRFTKCLSNFDSILLHDQFSEGLYTNKLKELFDNNSDLTMPKLTTITEFTNADIDSSSLNPGQNELVIKVKKMDSPGVQVEFAKSGKQGAFVVQTSSDKPSDYAKLYVLERIIYEIPSNEFMMS